MRVLVVDAPAAVELFLRSTAGRQVGEQLRIAAAAAVPAHFDAEVVAMLGRLVQAGGLEEKLVSPILAELARAPIRRYPVPTLLAEAWELRHEVAPRAALYITLARRLSAALVTTNPHLARASGLGVAVTVVG